MLCLSDLKDNFEINKIKKENITKQEAVTELNMYFNFKCGDCYLQAEGILNEHPEAYTKICRECFYDTKSKYGI